MLRTEKRGSWCCSCRHAKSERRGGGGAAVFRFERGGEVVAAATVLGSEEAGVSDATAVLGL
jgi:hypothetical protein